MSETIKNIQSLEFRSFMAALRAQSAAFWLLCCYILLEYIKPQLMYPALDILPWGQLTIVGCVAVIFLTKNKAIGFGAMDKLFITFSVVVVLSGVFAADPGESLSGWTTYTSWILMYFCVVSILTTPNKILLFVLFFILINFKFSQYGARTFAMRGFSFTGWGLAGQGWFRNSGELALQMVIIFSMSWCLLSGLREYISGTRRWWILLLLFPGTTALTVIGSSSRGGQIALLTVVLISILRGRYLFKRSLILAILLSIGWLLLPEEQIARFTTIGEDETSQFRLMHWEHALETINKHPWTGIGYRNWFSYYLDNYNLLVGRSEAVHNTVLEAFVELGYPGGILFIIMVLTLFIMNARSRREMVNIGGIEGKSIAVIASGINLGMIGAFISALFMSVLYYPMFWFAFALISAVRHISLNKVEQLNNMPTTLDEKPNTGFMTRNVKQNV